MTTDFLESISSWKMLSYKDLPNFDIYIDQLIQITEAELLPFSFVYSYQNITPSMVNNYVKLKVIDKPIKKKYNKDQLVSLIIISSLKSIYTITEIKNLIDISLKNRSYEDLYNNFSNMLKLNIEDIFLNKDINIKDKKDPIYMICNCVVTKLYIQMNLMNLKGDNIG